MSNNLISKLHKLFVILLFAIPSEFILAQQAAIPSTLTENEPDHHFAGVDVPFGVFTHEEIAKLESIRPDSSLSTKTPPLNINGDHSSFVLTFVIDLKDSSQPTTSDVFGNEVAELDFEEFGFAPSQFQTLRDAIIAEVEDDFKSELTGTVANQNGMELQINFIEGDIGTPPPGINEYYFIQVGRGISGPHVTGNILGVAGLGTVRNSSGTGPNFTTQIGDVVGSVFSANIQDLGGLTPFNALSSGNTFFTTNSLTGTISHEIGHTISLSHVNWFQSTQPTFGAPPIMGTGAIDLPNQQRIVDQEFSLAGFNQESNNSPVMHIDQLVSSVGLEFNGPIPSSSVNSIIGKSIGGLPEIMFHDGLNLELAIDKPTPLGQPAIAIELVSDTPILNPNSITLRSETLANTPNVNQRTEFFNTVTGEFDLRDERPASSPFDFDVTVTENVLDYVDQNTCQIRARVSFVPIGPVLQYPWGVDVDLLFFMLNN